MLFFDILTWNLIFQFILSWVELSLLVFYVTCNNISVMHICDGTCDLVFVSPAKRVCLFGFLSIFTSRQLKLSLNVLIRSIYLSIMETTRWDLSNDMQFALVYCCVGMLMTSCFGGSTPILGRKRITLLQPLGYCSGWTGQTKNVERP